MKLHVSYSNNLMVSITSVHKKKSKVIRYSGSTEKQTLQFDDEGNPLYSGVDNINYITENRNHDRCVADLGAHAIVVVNQDGELQFRFAGHSSCTKKNPFVPFGITTDSQGRILTADDSDNHCIHILDNE